MSQADRARRARALELFDRKFGHRADGVAVAPGRVNLIGEHTDYNDGLVLPMAIERAVTVAFRRRGDDVVRVHAVAAAETRDIDLKLPDQHRGRGWSAYVAGVAWAMSESGHRLRGADLLIESELPQGAGLASSAALEVAVHLALATVADSPWNAVEAATTCRRAEQGFVGVACGVMDQMVVAGARKGHAMLLDCRSLRIQFVELPVDASFFVIDTGVRRSLTDSAYNDRAAECISVTAKLARAFPEVRALRDVSVAQLDDGRVGLTATERNRALHVISENARVEAVVRALRTGDLRTAGGLFSQSHASLRDLYQVSCAELDAAVTAASAQPGCFGARMTGAGFGGCVLAMTSSGTSIEGGIACVASAGARTVG